MDAVTPSRRCCSSPIAPSPPGGLAPEAPEACRGGHSYVVPDPYDVAPWSGVRYPPIVQREAGGGLFATLVVPVGPGPLPVAGGGVSEREKKKRGALPAALWALVAATRRRCRPSSEVVLLGNLPDQDHSTQFIQSAPTTVSSPIPSPQQLLSSQLTRSTWPAMSDSQ